MRTSPPSAFVLLLVTAALAPAGCLDFGKGDSESKDSGASDGGADGADGASDGGADGASDGGADGASDGGADGASDGGADGADGADGASDGGADGGTDGSAGRVETVEVAPIEPQTTGLTVQAGDTIHFTAPGTWCWGGGADCSDADGTDGRPNEEEHPVLLEGSDFGTLVGQVDGGPVFAIGSDSTLVMPADGELSLGMNDRLSYYEDNSGSLTVTLTWQ